MIPNLRVSREPERSSDMAVTQKTDDIEPFVDEREGAEFAGISPHTLRKRRENGTGPTFHRVPGSRLVRYRISDIAAWIAGGKEVK